MKVQMNIANTVLITFAPEKIGTNFILFTLYFILDKQVRNHEFSRSKGLPCYTGLNRIPVNLERRKVI